MSWATLPEDARAFAERELTDLQLRVLRDRLNGHTWRTIGLGLGKDEATARGHWDRALRRMKPFYDEIRKAAA